MPNPIYFLAFGAPAPPPVPTRTDTGLVSTLVAFSQGNPCCMCPPLVNSPQKGGDGLMYQASKFLIQPEEG